MQSGEREKGMSKQYFIKTWGCQMNEHDSEKISGVLSSLGYCNSDDTEHADIILLNTCSVREKSHNKVFTFLGKLRKLKESNPDLIIGVCGCVAQHEKEDIFKKSPFVDFLLGPRSIGSLKSLIDQAKSKKRAVDFEMRNDFARLPYAAFARSTFPRAYITIMEGCNRRCTYCIVPQTRGREVCRSLEEIVAEGYAIADAGYQEVELLGQNVNSYLHERKTFVDLLAALHQIDPLKRLRFTTSHPSHLTEELMQLMKDSRKICNHLHLPLQSGSSKILRIMGRGYSAEEYAEKAVWLKQNIKDFTLSTDVIVGFPGESNDDFLKTISMLREIEFETIYSFAYSPRPGTAASMMKDDIPKTLKMERLYHLQNVQSSIQTAANKKWEGRCVEVLTEGKSKKSQLMLCGRMTNNKIVNFTGPNDLIGRFAHVTITESSVHSLIGQIG